MNQVLATPKVFDWNSNITQPWDPWSNTVKKVRFYNKYLTDPLNWDFFLEINSTTNWLLIIWHCYKGPIHLYLLFPHVFIIWHHWSVEFSMLQTPSAYRFNLDSIMLPSKYNSKQLQGGIYTSQPALKIQPKTAIFIAIKIPAMSAWISKNHTSTLIDDLKLNVFPVISRCYTQQICQKEK